MQNVSEISTALPPSEILTLFVVTLGPIKFLLPFAQRTKELSAEMQRSVALRAFMIASTAVVVGALLGQSTLARWHIPVPVLMITAGVVLFVVALKQVLRPYAADRLAAPDPLPPSPWEAAMRIVFPLIVTPYGIAAVIVLLAESGTPTRTAAVLGLLLGVMCLNLVAMLFARRMVTGPVLLALQVIGAVLAVLQVALAINFMLIGWRAM